MLSSRMPRPSSSSVAAGSPAISPQTPTGIPAFAAPSTSGMYEIYWRDMLVGTVLRLSDGVFGDPNNHSGLPSISADGMRVAYYSDASNLVLGDVNGARDVFVQQIGGNPVLVSRG